MAALQLIPQHQTRRTTAFGLPCETVSVVVIGRNEGERLAKCLEAVNRMRYPGEPLEKIYVDSDSKDGSAKRATQAGFTALGYRSTFRTAAGARDLGWRAAQSRFVLFLDGDCVVDPDFLQFAVKRCLSTGAVAVNGRVQELPGRHCAARRALAVYWEVAMRGEEGRSSYRGGCGLVERSALEEVGGFDVALAATENNELGRRLARHGKSAWYLDRPMVQHDSGVCSWAELYRHGLRDGY